MAFGAGIPTSSLGATVEISEIESLVKGELIVGDGSGAPSKLTVGADGCVLAALASEATGVRWATELKVSATAVTATVPVEIGDTTTSATGVITRGGARFAHNFPPPTGSTAIPVGFNTFVGVNAGNFTTGSTAT